MGIIASVSEKQSGIIKTADGENAINREQVVKLFEQLG